MPRLFLSLVGMFFLLALAGVSYSEDTAIPAPAVGIDTAARVATPRVATPRVATPRVATPRVAAPPAAAVEKHIISVYEKAGCTPEEIEKITPIIYATEAKIREGVFSKSVIIKERKAAIEAIIGIEGVKKVEAYKNRNKTPA